MRGCLTGLVLLILVAALLAGVGYYLLTQSAPRAASTTPIPVSSAAVRSFDDKVATVQQASGPVTVEITDQEATSKLAETLAAHPSAAPIENPQVAFRDGKIYISGASRDTPIPVSVLVIGRAEARDGLLVVTIEQVDSGRVPLPSSAKEQIVNIATTGVNSLNSQLPIYVTEVRVLDGRLVLTGRPK